MSLILSTVSKITESANYIYTVSVLLDFFFENPYFLNFFQHGVRIFLPCADFVSIFSLVDIRPLFSVLLLPKVPIVLTNVLNKNCIKFNFL